MTPQQIEALNIAGQCRATASSPLAKNILVDEGNGLLTELLLDAARIIEALAQPEQEPVATLEDLEQEIYQNTRNFVSRDVMEWMLKRYYTTPPQRTWVGLTDEEMHECWDSPLTPLGMKHARMIEAKLKQKNGFAEEKNT
jgi:hypothetical protein